MIFAEHESPYPASDIPAHLRISILLDETGVHVGQVQREKRRVREYLQRSRGVLQRATWTEQSHRGCGGMRRIQHRLRENRPR